MPTSSSQGKTFPLRGFAHHSVLGASLLALGPLAEQAPDICTFEFTSRLSGLRGYGVESSKLYLRHEFAQLDRGWPYSDTMRLSSVSLTKCNYRPFCNEHSATAGRDLNQKITCSLARGILLQGAQFKPGRRKPSSCQRREKGAEHQPPD